MTVTKIVPVYGKEHTHIQGWLEERCLVTLYCDKELKTRGFGIWEVVMALAHLHLTEVHL